MTTAQKYKYRHRSETRSTQLKESNLFDKVKHLVPDLNVIVRIMPPITTWIGYQKAMWCRKGLKKEDEENVHGRIVVITGANSGIGAVAALEFANRGAILVSCFRDVEKGQKVLDEIKVKVPTHNKMVR